MALPPYDPNFVLTRETTNKVTLTYTSSVPGNVPTQIWVVNYDTGQQFGNQIYNKPTPASATLNLTINLPPEYNIDVTIGLVVLRVGEGSNVFVVSNPAGRALNPPTNATATRVSDGQINVNWTNNSTTQRPWANVQIDRRVYNGSSWGSWVMLSNTVAGTATGYADTAVNGDTIYQYRVRALATHLITPYAETGEVYGYPNPPTNFANTRNSDYQNTLTWTNNSTPARLWTVLDVERSIDGGTWMNLSHELAQSTSAHDGSTQPNHSYAYRIRARNPAGATAWVYSGTTVNTPSAPGTPTAVRLSVNNVRITWANPGITETQVRVQRSQDKSAWAEVGVYAGSNVTTVDDSPGTGTWFYRVRNERGALISPWSAASNGVVSLSPPAAPTLTAPPSGYAADMGGGINYQWQHNPLDGAAQTAAQIRISTDGGTTWSTTIEHSGPTQEDLENLSGFEVNATVTWQVRTKGAYDGYGPWSSSNTFFVRQSPQVSLTSPVEIDDVPILMAWDYSDVSGTQIGYRITVTDPVGLTPMSTDYTAPVPTTYFVYEGTGDATSYVILPKDFLPENGKTYVFGVQVTSSSSLQSSRSGVEILVEYDAPEVPTGEIAEIDETRGSISIIAFFGDDDPDAPATDSLGVYRLRPDGSMLSLGEGLISGAAVVDRYPPLGEELSYIIVAYTDNGLSSRTEPMSTRLDGRGALYINYGVGLTQVAKIGLDRQIDWSKDSDIAEFVTAGTDPSPMVVFGYAQDMPISVSGTIYRDTVYYPRPDDPSSYRDLDAAADWRGIVVLRRSGGGVIPAYIKLSFSDGVERDTMSVSLTGKRVRAHGLVI
jgi:hypothetical protein